MSMFPAILSPNLIFKVSRSFRWKILFGFVGSLVNSTVNGTNALGGREILWQMLRRTRTTHSCAFSSEEKPDTLRREGGHQSCRVIAQRSSPYNRSIIENVAYGVYLLMHSIFPPRSPAKSDGQARLPHPSGGEGGREAKFRGGSRRTGGEEEI